MSAGRLFQTRGPATGKARVPIADSLNGGTTQRLVPAERRDCRLGKSTTRTTALTLIFEFNLQGIDSLSQMKNFQKYISADIIHLVIMCDIIEEGRLM